MPNAAHGFKRARPGRRCSGQEYRWIARAAQALPAAEAAEAMAAQSAVLCRACEKGYCKQRELRGGGMENTAAPLLRVHKAVPLKHHSSCSNVFAQNNLRLRFTVYHQKKCNGECPYEICY